MSDCGCTPLLKISDLSVRFTTQCHGVQAIEGIDLSINDGEKIALIGESGCGKTVLAMAVMGLLPANAKVKGSILFRKKDLLTTSDKEMQYIRGRNIAIIPQNSANALNPVMSIGEQILETLRDRSDKENRLVQKNAARLMQRLGFDQPEDALQKYPHQFSGGMRERVLIAMALAGNPDFIIADEPTSSLDVLVKGQILALLKEVVKDRALLLITHDLGTAYVLTTHVAVLYAGEIVEFGLTHDVLSYPLHPYTQGLLASLPSAGFHPIPGMSPSNGDMPEGCRFYPRCTSATRECARDHPELSPRVRNRKVRCHRYD